MYFHSYATVVYVGGLSTDSSPTAFLVENRGGAATEWKWSAGESVHANWRSISGPFGSDMVSECFRMLQLQWKS